MGGNNTPAPCSFCKGTRGMVSTFLDDSKRWIKQPYNPNGTAVDWFLFIGLMLACVFLWSRVINRILH
jgi:hypothetical protein